MNTNNSVYSIDNLENTIIMSIKKEPINRILDRSKNHEFRTRIPSRKIEYIFVYIPVPIKELKYVLKVDSPIKSPDKIKIDGFGNNEFNNGYKGYNYAYPIKEVYKINSPISLKVLKDKFKFTAPQSFVYGNRYRELLDYILKTGITKIF